MVDEEAVKHNRKQEQKKNKIENVRYGLDNIFYVENPYSILMKLVVVSNLKKLQKYRHNVLPYRRNQSQVHSHVK